jgi:hypothetical protein
MDSKDFNLPKVTSFLSCHSIWQDVFSKNYDLRGVFFGFGPPGYPFGVEFMTFTRLSHSEKGEFQIDITLFNEKGEKVSESSPRKILFSDLNIHDLITGWRVVFPAPGPYLFKVFSNNLQIGEYQVICR